MSTVQNWWVHPYMGGTLSRCLNRMCGFSKERVGALSDVSRIGLLNTYFNPQ